MNSEFLANLLLKACGAGHYETANLLLSRGASITSEILDKVEAVIKYHQSSNYTYSYADAHIKFFKSLVPKLNASQAKACAPFVTEQGWTNELSLILDKLEEKEKEAPCPPPREQVPLPSALADLCAQASRETDRVIASLKSLQEDVTKEEHCETQGCECPVSVAPCWEVPSPSSLECAHRLGELTARALACLKEGKNTLTLEQLFFPITAKAFASLGEEEGEVPSPDPAKLSERMQRAMEGVEVCLSTSSSSEEKEAKGKDKVDSSEEGEVDANSNPEFDVEEDTTEEEVTPFPEGALLPTLVSGDPKKYTGLPPEVLAELCTRVNRQPEAVSSLQGEDPPLEEKVSAIKEMANKMAKEVNQTIAHLKALEEEGDVTDDDLSEEYLRAVKKSLGNLDRLKAKVEKDLHQERDYVHTLQETMDSAKEVVTHAQSLLGKDPVEDIHQRQQRESEQLMAHLSSLEGENISKLLTMFANNSESHLQQVGDAHLRSLQEALAHLQSLKVEDPSPPSSS